MSYCIYSSVGDKGRTPQENSLLLTSRIVNTEKLNIGDYVIHNKYDNNYKQIRIYYEILSKTEKTLTIQRVFINEPPKYITLRFADDFLRNRKEQICFIEYITKTEFEELKKNYTFENYYYP